MCHFSVLNFTCVNGGSEVRYLSLANGCEADSNILKNEYKYGRIIGHAKLGQSYFLFRRRLTVYYIKYTDISAFFKRVVLVKAGGRELGIENIVICSGGAEVAQLQMPGRDATDELYRALRRLAPDADRKKPADTTDKPEDTEEMA